MSEPTECYYWASLGLGWVGQKREASCLEEGRGGEGEKGMKRLFEAKARAMPAKDIISINNGGHKPVALENIN